MSLLKDFDQLSPKDKLKAGVALIGLLTSLAGLLMPSTALSLYGNVIAVASGIMVLRWRLWFLIFIGIQLIFLTTKGQ